MKGIGNIGAFGALIETREADLLPGRRKEVTLLSDGEPLRAAVPHPKDHGPFACPPLAGLVTAGGRLLLAICDDASPRGIVAARDTNGAHIVATAQGGTVPVETRGADFYDNGPAEPIHALSWAEVAAAVQCFVAIMTAALAERCGGARALARAMAGEGKTDLEPTVRHWLALSREAHRGRSAS